MAFVGDDADFGSHFLDSLLEVEMTEEDKELDVSKNDDPLSSLPPIPTFDLQSESYSYNDTSRNSLPQPVFVALPPSTSTSSNVPLVINSNLMSLLTEKSTPANPRPAVSSVRKIPANPRPAVSCVRKIPQKILPKNSADNVNVSVGVNKNTVAEEIYDEKFMQKVFRPEFVKTVFTKSDPPWDISLVNEEEMIYYKSCFADVKKVQNCKLHCTVCDKHLGCAVTAEKEINVHKTLKVLTCKPCCEFYGDGNFPCDEGDNCEIYCGWCGQGGALVCCSFCPRVFCKKCVKRNFGPVFLKSIEKASDWACFCCAQKPLWPLRAICRALLEFIALKKTDPKSLMRDTSSCCKVTELNRKKRRDTQEKNTDSILLPQPKIKPTTSMSDQKGKLPTSVKTKREKLLLKPVVQLKASDRVKTSLKKNQNSKPSEKPNIFSPKSVVAGNNIIRGVTTAPPGKVFSAFPSPQFIQSPVLHGETLITPPSRFLMRAQPAANPTSNLNSPFVKVALTHQVPHLDINNIPTVKIPLEVQGLVLRLFFPDNKIQYIRLVADEPKGQSDKNHKDFSVPQSTEKSFVEVNLTEAFKISKVLYEKLMRIREKVTSKTKLTEESVFNSSVNKLHLVYENTIDLLKELDKSLLESRENWKKNAKSSVDVIDISDDETSAVKKNKRNRSSGLKEMRKKPSDDSDIEILDDVLVNGKTSTSNNFKEKYRLRRFSDRVIQTNHSQATRKRKGMRKSYRRLKMFKLIYPRTEENLNEGLEENQLTTSVDENMASVSMDVDKNMNNEGLKTDRSEDEEITINECDEFEIKEEVKAADDFDANNITMETHQVKKKPSQTPAVVPKTEKFPEVENS